MKRDLDEVVKSQQVMIGKNPDTFPVKLYNSYVEQLKFIEKWKEKGPGVELIYVDYKEVLENPEKMISKIEAFVGVPLKKEEMAKCIDKSLYRNKATKVKDKA